MAPLGYIRTLYYTATAHMCFTEEVSIAAWAAGMIGSFLLAWSGHVAVAIFLAWVVQMQMVETLLWARQPCSDPAVAASNVFVSELGVWINHLEPVALWAASVIIRGMIGMPSR